MVQGRELTDFHVDGVFKILVADNSFSILFEDTEKGKNLHLRFSPALPL